MTVRTYSTPTASILADGRVVLRGHYLPLLPHRLKATIPTHARHYDARSRRWTIDAEYADAAVRVFRDTFPDAAVFTPRGRAA